MELLAVLSDCIGRVGGVELHAQPEIHVQERQQRAEGHGAGLCYYAVFTPLSTLLGNWLVETCGWNEYLVTVMNMLLNFVTEYLFDTFVVFRGSMDTNDLAKKEEPIK